MKAAVGALLAVLGVFLLAAPALAQPGWHGHFGRNGVWIEADPFPVYPTPYPFPYVQYYPGPTTLEDGYGPPPPPTPAEQSRRYPSWFYCDAAYAYFPYVKTCASGFRPTPMGPPPQDAPSPDAISVQGLAWCADPQGLYPYVKTCAGGWTAETAARPAGAPGGPAARWFYCEEAKGFSPYVQTCASGWKEIAAAPPPVNPQLAIRAQARPPAPTRVTAPASGPQTLAMPPTLTPDKLPQPQ
ncbi:MAG: hypothetical protein WDN45_02435 [Caulobacteraceae bacterium]